MDAEEIVTRGACKTVIRRQRQRTRGRLRLENAAILDDKMTVDTPPKASVARQTSTVDVPKAGAHQKKEKHHKSGIAHKGALWIILLLWRGSEPGCYVS